jgi:hypothetical protein
LDAVDLIGFGRHRVDVQRSASWLKGSCVEWTGPARGVRFSRGARPVAASGP